MTYKLISSKSVLAKVMADLDLSEEELKVTDMREWIGEAVEKIGAVRQLNPKQSGVDGEPMLEIKGHQAPLPCDLHQLHQVAYAFRPCGPWFPMRKATIAFDVWNHNCCNDKCDKPEMLVQDDILVNMIVDIVGNIDKTQALDILNENENAKQVLISLINNHTVPTINGMYSWDRTKTTCGFQYNIKPGYIMTNVPCGFLKLSYNAIPTDDDGYPLVPDLASFSEAVYWYIVVKLMYPKRLRGEIQREDYYDIRRSWNFYRQQAYAELLMPNQDEMETIKNTWNKLVPEFLDHSTFYSHTGDRQAVYNQ